MPLALQCYVMKHPYRLMHFAPWSEAPRAISRDVGPLEREALQEKVRVALEA